ncbi:TPA: helix-turn-helix domain-containing protein, partial [Escherichia coli]|nr:helix-turn-helix domain-containing protein [Escherichia coli]
CHGGSDKMSPVLELLLDKTLDDNIIDKSKETELNEDIKGDDFLSMNESDLDSEATKETSKQDKEISDVTVISDQKDTQCHAAGDDELELFDDYLDEDLEREKELKCEQYKAEKKKRFELAKQKNRLSELDDFDDSDDDFTFAPRKKTRIEPKKEKVKVRCVYAGGMF